MLDQAWERFRATIGPFVGNDIRASYVHECIPYDAYLAAPGVSHSILRRMDPTPAHCLAYQNAPPEEIADDRLIGAVVHSALLRPSEPLPIVVRPPGVDCTTTAGKLWREEQLAAGKKILNEDDWTMVHALCRTARESALCRAIFHAGRAELSVKGRAQDKVSEGKQAIQAKGEQLKEKGEQLKDKAVELSHKAQEKAHEVTPERAQQAAGQAVEKAQQTAKQRPGLVAAVAAAAVAAGLLLRKLFRRRK